MVENPEFEPYSELEEIRAKKIAQFNDELRQTFYKGGMVYHSEAVMSLSLASRSALNFKIRMFHLFNYGMSNEHNSGSLSFLGNWFYWEIKYLDLNAWSAGSEVKSLNPESRRKTYRIMTIGYLREWKPEN